MTITSSTSRARTHTAVGRSGALARRRRRRRVTPGDVALFRALVGSPPPDDEWADAPAVPLAPQGLLAVDEPPAGAGAAPQPGSVASTAPARRAFWERAAAYADAAESYCRRLPAQVGRRPHLLVWVRRFSHDFLHKLAAAQSRLVPATRA